MLFRILEITIIRAR